MAAMRWEGYLAPPSRRPGIDRPLPFVYHPSVGDFRMSDRKRRICLALGRYQDFRCFHCGRPLILMPSKHRPQNHCYHLALHPLRATVDHIIPAAHFGPLHNYNIVIACRSCNERRGTRPISMGKLFALAQVRPELFYHFFAPEASPCQPQI